MINSSLLLIDGTILTIIFSVFVISGFLWNPRIWIHSFPADIQALAPPKTDQEKRWTVMFALPFFIFIFGGLTVTAIRYGSDNGFWGLLLHTYLIWQIVSLFDLVLLDWGSMLLIDPQNPPCPGTEGAKGYRDFAHHFFGFLKGSVMGAVVITIICGAVWLFLA